MVDREKFPLDFDIHPLSRRYVFEDDEPSIVDNTGVQDTDKQAEVVKSESSNAEQPPVDSPLVKLED